MAEGLEHRTCNLQAPSSSPALPANSANWICSCSPEFKSSATLVNSQLAGLVMFYLGKRLCCVQTAILKWQLSFFSQWSGQDVNTRASFFP